MSRFFLIALFVLSACGEGASQPVVADVQLMRGIADGAVGAKELVAPERGFVYISYYEDSSGESPLADSEGLVKIAELQCGAAANTRFSQLASRLKERMSDDTPPVCEGPKCAQSGMGEYDLDRTFSFRKGASRIELESVVEIEGGPVTKAFTDKAEAWARQRLTELADKRCPQS